MNNDFKIFKITLPLRSNHESSGRAKAEAEDVALIIYQVAKVLWDYCGNMESLTVGVVSC